MFLSVTYYSTAVLQELCLSWRSRLCRNPDRIFMPWCWVHVTVKQSDMQVPPQALPEDLSVNKWPPAWVLIKIENPGDFRLGSLILENLEIWVHCALPDYKLVYKA